MLSTLPRVKIKFILFFSLSVSLSYLIFTKIANAADTDYVNATVTAQNISVAVSDGVVAYGTLALSASEDTTTSGVNDSQTATNDGNITEDFNIRGVDSAAWTLQSSQGPNQYVHSYCKTTCDTTPVWVPLTLVNQTLATGVTTTGTQVFDLKIDVPSTSSSYAPQTVDVTVQAVQP